MDDQEKKQPERESKPLLEELPTDPAEIARREARNGLLQFDRVKALIDEVVGSKKRFSLRLSIVLELNRIATEGTNNFPGVFRPHNIYIEGSRHIPPDWREVPRLVEEMCDYVNNNRDKSPIHLSAFLMWRTNWIHPFSDGNGRTARAISYAVLCIQLGFPLPGTKTIPEQIAADKPPYYHALEAADRAYDDGKIEVSDIETLMGNLLAVQLLEIHRLATREQA